MNAVIAFDRLEVRSQARLSAMGSPAGIVDIAADDLADQVNGPGHL